VEGSVRIADGTQGTGKVLTSDANGTASWQAFSIPFYISGLSLEYVTNTTIRVSPGAADIGGQMLFATNYSAALVITNPADWVSGSFSANAWAYLYAYNDFGNIGYKFSGESPDLADHYGNTVGTLRYQRYALKDYRCIGALRTNGGKIRKYLQRGQLVMWDVPVSLTTTPSPDAWSAPLSCSNAIPAVSRLGVFAYKSQGGVGEANVAIKPNGGTWDLPSNGGDIAGAWNWPGSSRPGGIAVGSVICATDASQQIRYANGNDDVNCEIGVWGYYLNIR
jgi:hypothetical protein